MAENLSVVVAHEERLSEGVRAPLRTEGHSADTGTVARHFVVTEIGDLGVRKAEQCSQNVLVVLAERGAGRVIHGPGRVAKRNGRPNSSW